MVSSRKIANCCTEDSSKSNSQQRLIEMSTTTGRRWNLSGIQEATENIVDVTSAVGQQHHHRHHQHHQHHLPTFSESTTHQKVNRIIAEHKSKLKNREKGPKSSAPISNYIVASKGSLSPGFYAIKENTSCPKLTKERKNVVESPLAHSRTEEIVRTGKIHGQKSSSNNWDKKKDSGHSRSHRGITKSSSVPVNLKEGLGTGPPGKLPNDGILKRPSVVEKFTEVNSAPGAQVNKKNVAPSSRVHRVITNLKKSPSLQTLNIAEQYSRSAVRKSSKISLDEIGRDLRKKVSFSSDTSFAEKKSLKKSSTTVHEAKVYCRGVLKDFSTDNPKKKPFKSASGETMSQMLLRAARDADEFALNDIISRIRRCNLSSIDVNITDSSGRSAISYMAGNGAADVLETVLSFPGADPNLPDNEGNTPLHFAAQAGQAECLNILLQKTRGIELDARNVLGFTPLMKAALQGRTKCAKILLFAGANPTLRDHGRGLRAEQWARFCGRHVCSEVIERFARHRLIDKSSCRWGSEPELASKVLQGKIIPVSLNQPQVASSGLKSKIKRVFKNSNSDKNFSLVSQLTNAALCASSPVLPKPGDVSTTTGVIRTLNVPQLRVTLVSPVDILEKYDVNYAEKSEPSSMKPARVKRKNK